MSATSLLDQPVQVERARVLKRVVWVLTVVVFILVLAMRSPYKIPVSDDLAGMIKLLPSVMAFTNTLVAALLLGGLWSILRKRYRLHQSCMTSALVLSVVFLLCYVSYHFTTVETLYGDLDRSGEIDEEEAAVIGSWRFVYLGVLITHIIAAAVSFPMILMTFVHSWTRNFERHRKLARKVFPLWLFVAVTGPLCYWMLKPYY